MQAIQRNRRQQPEGENIELVKAADMTILCDMPFGLQNIRNLEAAAYASELIIIEDTDPQTGILQAAKPWNFTTG